MYDVDKIMQRVPTLMGLDLKPFRGTWVGGYYLDGHKHATRNDKMRVKVWGGRIRVYEEGGESMSLVNWLSIYGNIGDTHTVLSLLNNPDGIRCDINTSMRVSEEKDLPLLFVPEYDIKAMRSIGNDRNPLWKFLPESVRKAWERYNVMTDSYGNTVYWYRDTNGNVLHDNRIKYMEDGHRDRSVHPVRRYTVGKGYRGRCLFGSHLRKSRRAYIVESEKTAILFSHYFDRLCLATGGKSKLSLVEKTDMLVPDLDAADKWAEKGEIWRWWDYYYGSIEAAREALGSHADIGDMIIQKIKSV